LTIFNERDFLTCMKEDNPGLKNIKGFLDQILSIAFFSYLNS